MRRVYLVWVMVGLLGCAGTELTGESEKADMTAITPDDDSRPSVRGGSAASPPAFENADDPDQLRQSACWSEESDAFSCEESCQSVACCIGEANCCEDAVVEQSVDFGSCDGLSCLVGATTFGAARTDQNMFVGGGNLDAQGGVVIADLFNTQSQSIEVSVAFQVPNCEDACIESAGVGLTNSSDELPTIAMSLSGSRRAVSLILSGEEVARAPLGDESTSAWTLSLKPSGELTATGPAGELLGPFFVNAPQESRLVLFGRNQNPNVGETSAGILELQVTTQQCDPLGSWHSKQPLSATNLFDGATSPAAVAHQGGVLLAFVVDGAIRFAQRGASDTEFRAIDLLVDDSDATTQYKHPGLAVGPNGIRLSYEQAGASGSSLIWRSLSEDFVLGEEEPIVLPSKQPVFEPSMIYSNMAGRWLLVARVGARLEAFISTQAGLSWSMRGEMGLAGQFSEPRLAEIHGAFHVYATEEVGTRSHVRLLVSDDFQLFRLHPEPSLVPSNNIEEDDSFRVRSASVVPNENSLAVFYTAFDGIRYTLRQALRATAPRGILR